MVSSNIVIKLGGYAFSPDPDVDKISGYVDAFKKMISEGHKLLIVAGGGKYSRKCIETARSLGADEATCDQLGIHVSKINAMLLISALGEGAYPNAPEDMKELREAIYTSKVVVSGGLFPAQSTDAVAAIIAEMTHADLFIKATDVDGVYTSDPNTDPKARKLDEIHAEELYKIIVGKPIEAGVYELLDPQALRVMMRSRIPTVIIDGRDPENILKVAKGFKLGTRITF